LSPHRRTTVAQIAPQSDRTCSEEVLVQRARDGDQRAVELLVDRYRSYIRFRSTVFFLPGWEREDVVQEGLIGLYKAIRDYRPDRHTAFGPFARLCIDRQIIAAVKGATRAKHAPLNTAASLSEPWGDDPDGRPLLEVLADRLVGDPEDAVLRALDEDAFVRWIHSSLSELERAVVAAYLAGFSYEETARLVRRHVKAVDNALQRVKRKLQRSRLAAWSSPLRMARPSGGRAPNR
jgi:RNA polymerase sporulation-specific sigma factor